MTASMSKLLFVGLILCATCAHATGLVEQRWVSVTRSLSGQVVVHGTDEPASGVTVELCSPGWKKVIGSTKTDNKGHFSLEQVAKSKLFYLRVSAPCMDIYELGVHIDKHAGQELNIHLSVAT
jgi:Carboxypeptidase regulatory-like domain